MANPNLSSNKTVNLNYGTIGDTLIYTLIITNSGDTSANNIIVTDLLPQGIDFIADSIQINGISQPGVNPALGISIGTIPISSRVTINFSALVITVPSNGALSNSAQIDYQYNDPLSAPTLVNRLINSNTVTTTINCPLLTFTKSSVTTIASGSGQIITYDISLTNLGTAAATSLTFLDTIPTGTSFVANSVNVLSTPLPGTSLEPPAGFTFNSLPINSLITLSFQVTIQSIPSNNIINNICDLTYNYVVDPILNRRISTRISTNQYSIPAQSGAANLSSLSKGVDKAYVKLGDILTYTITIPNNGNLSALNVIVVDTPPNGTTYVPNSLRVNGSISSSPLTNIYVGTIAAGSVATIQFRLSINN